MSLSFFTAWDEAENHSAQLFNWLIPGSDNYKNLRESYSSWEELTLGLLAPFYAPFLLAAATICAILIALCAAVAALGAFLLIKVSDLFNNNELSNNCSTFLTDSSDFAKLDACISLIFIALTLISFPYAVISAITRTVITLNHHFYPPQINQDDLEVKETGMMTNPN